MAQRKWNHSFYKTCYSKLANCDF